MPASTSWPPASALGRELALAVYTRDMFRTAYDAANRVLKGAHLHP